MHPPGIFGELPQSPHLSNPAAQALPSQCHHCPRPSHSQLSLFLLSSSAPACLGSNQAADSRQDGEGQHGRGMDHLRSTRHREGAEGPKKGTWGGFGCWDHSNLQAHVTSDLAEAQGWSRTTAEGSQDTGPSETGLCKAGGLSIEEASGFILPVVITACDNLWLPVALFSGTTKSFCKNTETKKTQNPNPRNHKAHAQFQPFTLENFALKSGDLVKLLQTPPNKRKKQH